MTYVIAPELAQRSGDVAVELAQSAFGQGLRVTPARPLTSSCSF